MIEIAFLAGVVLGVSGVLGIQYVNNWISKMRREIESVRWDLERAVRQREDWTEFMFWKQNHKSKE